MGYISNNASKFEKHLISMPVERKKSITVKILDNDFVNEYRN